MSTLGSLVLYIDIHDLQLSVKDVFIANNPHTILYTQLPHTVCDLINYTHFNFNDTIEDVVILKNNKNDTYSQKSGYNLLLKNVDPVGHNLPLHSWSWIWKL